MMVVVELLSANFMDVNIPLYNLPKKLSEIHFSFNFLIPFTDIAKEQKVF
jgi:hypothetical protein